MLFAQKMLKNDVYSTDFQSPKVDQEPECNEIGALYQKWEIQQQKIGT
jgi:hypothetical protein